MKQNIGTQQLKEQWNGSMKHNNEKNNGTKQLKTTI
jgi:hypothetical protein